MPSKLQIEVAAELLHELLAIKDVDELISGLATLAAMKDEPGTVEGNRRGLIRTIVLRLTVLVMQPDYIPEVKE